MYHSITFGNKNTWDDWHLIPSSRPRFSTPEQKTSIIDIQGADGSLDSSYILTKYPVFDNRKGSFDFIVANGYGDWTERYSDIMDYLHGRKLKAILEDDLDYYYYGRFTVNDWTSNNDGTWSEITIDYEVEPYKKLNEPKTFSFSGAQTITLYGDQIKRMPTCPKFTVSNAGSGMSIQLINPELGINVTKTFANGTHQDADFVLTGMDPDNTCTIKMGAGNLGISFESGRL